MLAVGLLHVDVLPGARAAPEPRSGRFPPASDARSRADASRPPPADADRRTDRFDDQERRIRRPAAAGPRRRRKFRRRRPARRNTASSSRETGIPNTAPTFPLLPIEAMLPTDPMLATLPSEPTLARLNSDPMLAMLPADATQASEPELAREAMLPAEALELIDPALPVEAMLPAESADPVDPGRAVGRRVAGVGSGVMRAPARRWTWTVAARPGSHKEGARPGPPVGARERQPPPAAPRATWLMTESGRRRAPR